MTKKCPILFPRTHYRDNGMIYNGLIFGVPVVGGPTMMFHCNSTFERHKWHVPETLEALLDFARANNGTDGKWAICLPW